MRGPALGILEIATIARGVVSADAALKRAAKYGDAWLPYLITPEQYTTGLGRLAEYATEQGSDASSWQKSCQVYVGIHDTKAEALAAAMTTTARSYNLNEQQVERFCAIGTPAEVVERLQQFVDAGVRYFVVQWSCRMEDVTRNIEVFAKEVIPALRKA